jgi:hypothetical protein
MATLRFTLLDLLARLFQRWADALSARIAPRRAALAETRFTADDPSTEAGPVPPDHWLDTARIQPPQHWLDTVREHAPGLLEADSRDVIDWEADETARYSPAAAETPAAHNVWDERPLPLPPSPGLRSAAVPGRALRLLGVKASLPVAETPLNAIVSKTGRAAKLRVAATPSPQPLRMSARGARQPEERISPRLVTAGHETSLSTPMLNQERSQMALGAGKGFSTRFQDNGMGGKAASSSRRPRLRHVRSTLAAAASLPETRSQPAAPPDVRPVWGSPSPPANVVVHHHPFPALLDDPQEPEWDAGREMVRRQRLDAEQEGRAWSE